MGQDCGWVDQVVYVPNSVPTAPMIQSQPLSRTVIAQTTVSFTVGAIGSTPLGYQWRFNGVNLTNGPGVSGVTTTALTLTNVQAVRAGNDSVVVTNSVGSDTSVDAVLTVVTAPLITAQPGIAVSRWEATLL